MSPEQIRPKNFNHLQRKITVMVAATALAGSSAEAIHSPTPRDFSLPESSLEPDVTKIQPTEPGPCASEATNLNRIGFERQGFYQGDSSRFWVNDFRSVANIENCAGQRIIEVSPQTASLRNLFSQNAPKIAIASNKAFTRDLFFKELYQEYTCEFGPTKRQVGTHVELSYYSPEGDLLRSEETVFKTRKNGC